MTSVDSNFNFLCGRPPWLDSPPPVHMRPPKPDSPFRVDIINGWPLNSYRRIILLHLPPLPYSCKYTVNTVAIVKLRNTFPLEFKEENSQPSLGSLTQNGPGTSTSNFTL